MKVHRFLKTFPLYCYTFSDKSSPSLTYNHNPTVGKKGYVRDLKVAWLLVTDGLDLTEISIPETANVLEFSGKRENTSVILEENTSLMPKVRQELIGQQQ